MDYDSIFDRRSAVHRLELDEIASCLRTRFGHVVDAELLAGGYCNSNYRVRFANGGCCLMRVLERDSAAVEREVAILRHFEGRIPVQRVLSDPERIRDGRLAFFCLEYLDGVPLHSVEDTMEPEDLVQVARQLGRILARIHETRFGSGGWLGSSLQVVSPFSSFHASVAEFYENMLGKSGLSPAACSQIRTYVRRMTPRLADGEATDRMVHSDFNSKNILVRKQSGWEVVGILDWEFAFAASPLIDFGNFFRFRQRLPGEYLAELPAAYRAAGGDLPEDWMERMDFHDLLAVLNFLANSEDRPRTRESMMRLLREKYGFGN